MGNVVNLKNKETCIICEKTTTVGIHICNQLICENCQNELIETDVNDDRYKFFIEKLGKLSVKIKEPKIAGKC
ncbi:hypothetical protein GCM10011391_35900 [Pullulanibacillus camelliae]|uniref:Inhibitor of sigma-G Gin n=1 Tax=Pullulanibacillus camelliae TaxID=1707096 RepID=A0A8J2YLV3_9BACL|nr:sigma factor G inhibitor Gin [Pullulanibacillus camelliae]GGE53821.1 hypothetical protein GCM10011391_35900 [Pullulanibacillus camelliae]